MFFGDLEGPYHIYGPSNSPKNIKKKRKENVPDP